MPWALRKMEDVVFEDKRTKIVCTLGPSTEDDDVLREMIRAGMNVARLNFSHGDHEYHRNNIERVRRISDELGTPVAILTDTKGPEIRTRANKKHRPILLATGDEVDVTTADVKSNNDRIALDYEPLPQEVGAGDVIFIDDGLIGLEVKSVEGDVIHCTVTNGGTLGEHKGVNIPNVASAFVCPQRRGRGGGQGALQGLWRKGRSDLLQDRVGLCHTEL